MDFRINSIFGRGFPIFGRGCKFQNVCKFHEQKSFKMHATSMKILQNPCSKFHKNPDSKILQKFHKHAPKPTNKNAFYYKPFLRNPKSFPKISKRRPIPKIIYTLGFKMKIHFEDNKHEKTSRSLSSSSLSSCDFSGTTCALVLMMLCL